jgi:hypothetical protein
MQSTRRGIRANCCAARAAFDRNRNMDSRDSRDSRDSSAPTHPPCRPAQMKLDLSPESVLVCFHVIVP